MKTAFYRIMYRKSDTLNFQVALHSSPDDCWVSFLGGVYDLSSLIKVIICSSRLIVSWKMS